MIEYSIYPSEDDLIDATETWISEKHPAFYESMTEKAWKTYYTKNIAAPVNIFNFLFLINFE